MRRRATKKQLMVSLGVLAAVAAAGAWWWPHLMWGFLISRNQVRIPSVPVSELAAPGKTADWYDCRIGPMSLKLPPDLAENADRTVGKTSINFTHAGLEMTILVPHKILPGQQQGMVQLAASFNRSPLQLVADSYRASSDDFRWTMSHAELRRHQVLLSLGQHFPHFRAAAVETRYAGDVERMLIIGDRRTASFEWRTTSGLADGNVTFAQKDRDLDLDMVRDICQSVTCDVSQLALDYTKSGLEQLLDTIEIARPPSTGSADGRE